MAFNERLRDLRTKRDMSQSQLATALGISKSAISMYELGERQPDFETLELIADYFNVDMNYLLGNEDRSTYYLEPEVAELAQELYARPEMRVLFDASRKASAEDIQFVINMLERMNK